MTCQTCAPPVRNGLLARIGDAMQRHQKAIRGIQWVVVLFYIVLVALPAFLPLPDPAAAACPG